MNAKLLLDENLSPWVAETLRKNDGVDVFHVRDRGLLRTPDSVILERAYREDRILVTSNVDDFVKLARAREVHPGVVLIEEGDLLRDEQLRVVRRALTILAGERDLLNRVLRIWSDGTTLFDDIPAA